MLFISFGLKYTRCRSLTLLIYINYSSSPSKKKKKIYSSSLQDPSVIVEFQVLAVKSPIYE